MTREEIIRIVEEEEVEFIRLQFTDLFGIFKNIAITSSQLERALDGRCMFDVPAAWSKSHTGPQTSFPPTSLYA